MRKCMAVVLCFCGLSLAQAAELGQPSVVALQTQARDDTQVANDYLRVMRDEIKHSEKKKSVFSFLGTSATPLQQALLDDLDQYLVVYGDKSLSVEALQLKAILHNRMDKDEALAMDFLTIISAYSGSRYEKSSRNGLNDLLSGSLKSEQDILGALLKQDFASMPSQEDRLLALLRGLAPIQQEAFHPLISNMCAHFLVRYPNDVHDDEVQYIRAGHAGKEDHVAVYRYRTLLAVYPQSPLRADATLAIGDIQRTGLKEYETAVVTYRQLIKDFPSSEAAKHAYIHMALTQSRHLRLYQEALVTLNIAVEKYVDDPVVKEALNMLGGIYAKKTKEYAKAVESYRKLSNIFSGEDGLQALREAEDIANASMHDYPLVIAIDEQMLHDYSDDAQAAEVLLHIGDTYADKLKQRTEAIKAYQRVIERYPNSKEARKASSKIRKLEKGTSSSSLF